MTYIMGIDGGGNKTFAVITDETGRLVGRSVRRNREGVTVQTGGMGGLFGNRTGKFTIISSTTTFIRCRTI